MITPDHCNSLHKFDVQYVMKDSNDRKTQDEATLTNQRVDNRNSLRNVDVRDVTKDSRASSAALKDRLNSGHVFFPHREYNCVIL